MSSAWSATGSAQTATAVPEVAAPEAPAPEVAPEAPAPAPAPGVAAPEAAASKAAVSEAPASVARAPSQPSAGEQAALATDDSEPRRAYASGQRPGSGLGLLVAGWVLSGLGALNLVTLPLCFLDLYPDSARQACKIATIAVAGVELGVGIPLIIAGSAQRNEYKAWKSTLGAKTLGHLQVSVRRDRAFLLYRTAF